MELAGGIDDSYQTLLIVGHNPGLEDFILNVSRNTQPHRAQVNYKFYPGDVAIIEWAQSNWGGIQFKDAVLTDIFSVKKNRTHNPAFINAHKSRQCPCPPPMQSVISA